LNIVNDDWLAVCRGKLNKTVRQSRENPGLSIAKPAAKRVRKVAGLAPKSTKRPDCSQAIGVRHMPHITH